MDSSVRTCVPEHVCAYKSAFSDARECVYLCVRVSQWDQTSGETTVYLTCSSPDGGGSLDMIKKRVSVLSGSVLVNQVSLSYMHKESGAAVRV